VREKVRRGGQVMVGVARLAMPEVCRQPRDPRRNVNPVLIPAEQRLDRERVPVVMNSRAGRGAGADLRVLAQPVWCGSPRVLRLIARSTASGRSWRRSVRHDGRLGCAAMSEGERPTIDEALGEFLRTLVGEDVSQLRRCRRPIAPQP
jgi:hypothetical protein